MRSGANGSTSPSSIDDRTAKARIRDAAIECFAEHGISGATARKVAAAASVSPGLVIHHFGSMQGLRRACDEHVAASIREEKQKAMSAGPIGFDLLPAIRTSRVMSLTGYLAQVLGDDSPTVARLVDDLIADAEVYMQQGVESGMLRPVANPRGVAAVLTLWSLGALVLHRHAKRIFGIDPTDPGAGTNPAIASYLGPGYEVLGEGILTQSVAERLQDAVAAIADGEPANEPPMRKGTT